MDHAVEATPEPGQLASDSENHGKKYCAFTVQLDIVISNSTRDILFHVN